MTRAEMEVRYVLEKDDMWRFYLFAYRRRGAARALAAVAILAAVAVGGWQVLGGHSLARAMALTIVVAVGVIGLYYAWVYGVVRRRLLAAFSGRPRPR